MHVRLADDDRARGAQPFDDGRVPVRDVLRERRLTPGRVHAFDVEGVLDGHRDAVQRPDVITARDRPIRLLGGLERDVAVGFDNGVERGLPDAVEEFSGQVMSRERPTADPGGHLGGGSEGHAPRSTA